MPAGAERGSTLSAPPPPAARSGRPSVAPSLEDVRPLVDEHSGVALRHTCIDDCETPGAAYLKLRGDGPSFLLESAEQGQRFGRWSFVGVRPRTTVRLEGGVLSGGGRRREPNDPYGTVAAELGRHRAAPPAEGEPPFAGGAVGLFG